MCKVKCKEVLRELLEWMLIIAGYFGGFYYIYAYVLTPYTMWERFAWIAIIFLAMLEIAFAIELLHIIILDKVAIKLAKKLKKIRKGKEGY